MVSIDETSERLLKQGISLYKISEILGEPKSTIQNMFNGHSKYSDRKINSVLKRINSYLDELESTPETTVPVNPDLSLKLFRLGLDSKVFTPEEKLQLALAHKKLTESKNQNQNNHE